jgi:hypothetical protein
MGPTMLVNLIYYLGVGLGNGWIDGKYGWINEWIIWNNINEWMI